MLLGKENRPRLVALTGIFPVELPGIESGTKVLVSCGNASFQYVNDAKVRQTTCGYARGVTASTRRSALRDRYSDRGPGCPSRLRLFATRNLRRTILPAQVEPMERKGSKGTPWN